MKFTAHELNRLGAVLAREQERRKYRSHAAFTLAAWPIIEPGTPFKDNWHLHAISDHLEAVSAGHIKLLIINIPPRHMKSIGVSVTWCPWEWGPMARPHVRWLYASYAGSLSIRDSLKARRIIQSEWYQRLWGSEFQLSGDQNAKLRFENTRSGYRLATSVGGLGTGEGGDRVVCDDPHNVQEGESEAVRESTVEWWSKTMSTRLNDPETGAFVVVMQRVHAKDVSGYELAEQAEDFGPKGQSVHLCLPAEYEPERKCRTYVNGKKFFEDPRQKKDELLWPERFGLKAITALKRKLGSYGTAGQLQQRPSPEGGGIIPVRSIRLWPADLPLPQIEFIVQSYDTAYTEKTNNDPCACTVWGIFSRSGIKNALLLDAWDEYYAYPELRQKVIEDWNATYGGDPKRIDNPPRRSDVVLVEEKGSGISLLQDMRRAGVPGHPYNPGRADKVARAHAIAPIIECEFVWVLESRREPKKPISWARAMITQCEEFPNGEHDDYVDTMTQALIYLRDSDLITLPEAAIDLPAPRDYRGQPGNPYFK